MIKKLRHKFILILMGVVTLILLTVFFFMLISTWNNNQRMGENMLRQSFEMQPPQPDFKLSQTEGGKFPVDRISPKARMSILVAEIKGSGEISVQTNQLYFINEEEIESIIHSAMNTNNRSGILQNYELRWLKSDDGTRIAFADISMEQEMLESLIINLLLIGSVALTAFFFVSILLSRWAVRPVELAWERQRQFVADASHELKTPLTVILSNVHMLGNDDLTADEKKVRRIGHIRAEAERMRKLVEDMLMLAKSDYGENKIIQDRVDFSFVVTNTILTFEPIAFDEQKSLFYNVQDNIFVTGDTMRLQQLVHILLDNACKYCSSKGNIRISLNETDRKTALLTVFNDGEPIPKEEIEQIFLRFYRVDKSRSTHGHFGLGLSIAESIVREHNGKIWAESGDKTGNSFFVTLPLE